MWSCPACGARVEDSVERCWGCGWRPSPGDASPARVAGDDPSQGQPPRRRGDRPEPPPRPAHPAREPDARTWTCPNCGERVDDDFDVCWNCGTTHDGVEDPHFVREVDAGQPDEEPEMGAPDPGAITDADLDAREALYVEGPPTHEPPPAQRLICPRCGGAMAVGYVVFPSQRETFEAVPASGAWFAGQPPAATWSALLKEVEHYPLRAYRCEGCGRLEFYARD
jgi:hypothetical protein